MLFAVNVATLFSLVHTTRPRYIGTNQDANQAAAGGFGGFIYQTMQERCQGLPEVADNFARVAGSFALVAGHSSCGESQQWATFNPLGKQLAPGHFKCDELSTEVEMQSKLMDLANSAPLCCLLVMFAPCCATVSCHGFPFTAALRPRLQVCGERQSEGSWLRVFESYIPSTTSATRSTDTTDAKCGSIPKCSQSRWLKYTWARVYTWQEIYSPPAMCPMSDEVADHVDAVRSPRSRLLV